MSYQFKTFSPNNIYGGKYWVIVFFENRQPMKLRFTSKSFKSFYYWLGRNGYHWTAINVYERYKNGGSGDFICQLTSQNYWQQIQSL